MIAAKNDATNWTTIALGLLLTSLGEFSTCIAQDRGEASRPAEIVCRVEGLSTIHSIVRAALSSRRHSSFAS